MYSIIFSLLLFIHPQQFMSQEITLTSKGEDIQTITRSELSLSSIDPSFLDESKLEKLATDIESKVYKLPKNAILDEHHQIVSGKNGYKLNRTRFKEKLIALYYSDKQADLEIPLQTLYPNVSSELLESIKQKKIGEYKTYFNPHNKTRTQNILLASNAINNYVLFPGERFSFNEVVGQRTTDKGYLPAPVIVKGELTEGIGGGICQVSSTLFNAVDYAGAKILERYSHSKQVHYVPPKRDATVSWYGPDFSFKNNYQYPLLIRSTVKKGQLLIEVFSSDLLQVGE